MTQHQKEKILHNLYLQKSFGFRYLDFFRFDKAINHQNFMSEENLKHCVLCDASKLTQNKVFQQGDIKSKIIFITTVPIFDDASREMFLKMLQNVLGLASNEIYMTSIIKCDIDFKNPSLESFAHSCKGYILNQLQQSDAPLLVTLGESYNILLQNGNDLSLVHGTLIKFLNKTLVPIYHPSFLLRNPSLKKETFEDLKKIKLLLEQL